MAIMEDDISVVCPECKRSVIISFVSKHGDISVDPDECPKCGFDWEQDIIDQIEVDLEDSPCYDEEMECLRQAEYDSKVITCIYDHLLG